MATRLWRPLLCCLVLSLALAGHAIADEILLLNGDRLTGTIVGAAGGKLTIKTEAAGDVTVDLAKVKSFSTTEPVVLKTGDTTVRSRVTATRPEHGATAQTTRFRAPSRDREHASRGRPCGRSSRHRAATGGRDLDRPHQVRSAHRMRHATH